MNANKIASLLREQHYEGKSVDPQKGMNPMGKEKIPRIPPSDATPQTTQLDINMSNDGRRKRITTYKPIDIEKKTEYNASK